MHLLTKSLNHELRIDMKHHTGEARYAKYTEFMVDSEDNKFALTKIGSYSGDAGKV